MAAVAENSAMPFKSQAQRRKFAELLVKGEISPETYEAWNRDTGSARLPERINPAKKRRKSSRAKSKARTKSGRSTKVQAKSKRKGKRSARR